MLIQQNVLEIRKATKLTSNIKYLEKVAQIFPHFEGNKLPDFGKNNLWFLLRINNKVCHRHDFNNGWFRRFLSPAYKNPTLFVPHNSSVFL